MHHRALHFFLLLIAVAMATLALAPPAVARASGPNPRDSVVVITGHVTIGPRERVDNVVVIDGPVRIDGRAKRVFAFNGDVVVSGTVTDNVYAFNGRVSVTESGHVGGDVTSSDRARITPGARVDGSVERFRGRFVLPAFGLLAHFVIWLAVSVSLFALGALLLLLAPRAAEATSDAARTAVGPAIGWGLALAIGLPVAGIVALFTIVGAPFGVGLLLALSFVYSIGYVVGAFFLGRLVVRPPRSRWLAFLAGWGILRAVALVPVLGTLWSIAATIYGLGAVAVAIWRTRTRVAVKEPEAQESA